MSYSYFNHLPFLHHLRFNYFTETKGGYLQGKIYLPREKLQDGDGPNSRKCSNYFLRVSLGPANIEPELNPFHIHPLLLYLNTRQNRRKRQSKVKIIIGKIMALCIIPLGQRFNNHLFAILCCTSGR